MLFGIRLSPDGPVAGLPLSRRRQALEDFVRRAGRQERISLTPCTRDPNAAERWLNGYAGTDGVIAKRLGRPYESGERAMIKVKRMKTADCVVGGFRYEEGRRTVGSLLLGLYNSEGRLDHVGLTSSISAAERLALSKSLRRCESLRGLQARRLAGPVAGAQDAASRGSRCGPTSLRKCASIMQPECGFGTGPRFFCVGAQTSRRGPARSTSSRLPRLRSRKQWPEPLAAAGRYLISPLAVFLASDAANLVTGAENEVTADDSAKDV